MENPKLFSPESEVSSQKKPNIVFDKEDYFSILCINSFIH